MIELAYILLALVLFIFIFNVCRDAIPLYKIETFVDIELDNGIIYAGYKYEYIRSSDFGDGYRKTQITPKYNNQEQAENDIKKFKKLSYEYQKFAINNIYTSGQWNLSESIKQKYINNLPK